MKKVLISQEESTNGSSLMSDDRISYLDREYEVYLDGYYKISGLPSKSSKLSKSDILDLIGDLNLIIDTNESIY